ncbi:MAG: hypothetical protein IPO40_14480 [Fibrobacteres bacterium]|nr:hypothetical protein [Fibrobacterota bacterium]
MSRGLAQALSRYREMFANRKDPRLAVWEKFPPALQTRAALLATVLGQDLTVAGLARLLAELRTALGDERLLGMAPCTRVSLGRACGERTWLVDWPHRASLDGWVLSAMDFLRVHGDPGTWRERFESPTNLVGTLALEIPWMGAGSPSRVKGWRLARWLVRGEVGAGWTEGASELKTPVRVLERPLGALGWQPSGWDEWPRPRRQAWWDAMASEVAPGDPAALWVPLETVLARGKAGPACQEHLGGCGRCPVREWCPSPQRSAR